MFVGLVRLTNNHMFGSDNIWDKSPTLFLKVLKLPSFYSGNFKIFKNAIGQSMSICPPKYVITSTYCHCRQVRTELKFQTITHHKIYEWTKKKVIITGEIMHEYLNPKKAAGSVWPPLWFF